MEYGIKSQLLFKLDFTLRSPITRRCLISNILVMIAMVYIILIRSCLTRRCDQQKLEPAGGNTCKNFWTLYPANEQSVTNVSRKVGKITGRTTSTRQKIIWDKKGWRWSWCFWWSWCLWYDYHHNEQIWVWWSSVVVARHWVHVSPLCPLSS